MARINVICQKLILLNFLCLVIAIVLIPISVNCEAEIRIYDQNYRKAILQQDRKQLNANQNAKPKHKMPIEDQINAPREPIVRSTPSQIARMFFEPVELDIKTKQAAKVYKEQLLAGLKPSAQKEDDHVKMTGLRCARQNDKTKFKGTIYNV